MIDACNPVVCTSCFSRICHDIAAHAFILFVFIFSFSSVFYCSDSFINAIDTEKLAVRKGNQNFTLMTGTTIISFTEFDDKGEVGKPGIFKARLSALPESTVVLDLLKANQLCTTPGVNEKLIFTPEKLVFTPENYSQEQEVEIMVVNDLVVDEARGHRVFLPKLESYDPLYNDVTTPTLYITVFEDDIKPQAFPISPDFNEESVFEYTDIVISFNKPMHGKSINTTSIKLLNDENEVIPAYIDYNNNNNTAIISPKSYLRNNSIYTVELINSIEDIYGNRLDTNVLPKWQFKTRWQNIISIANVDTPGNSQRLFKSENLIYIADGNSGLSIVDVSNPRNPLLRRTFSTSNYTTDVYVVGAYAYVATENSFLVIDISNTSSPVLKKTLSMTAHSILIKGSLAYVACWESGLKIIDITNPLEPIVIGNCNTPGYAAGIALSGDYAFIADCYQGMQVVDVSNPLSPKLIGNCDTPDVARGIAIKDNYAYISDFQAGLHEIDITNPLAPSLTSTIDLPSNALNVTIAGDFAYIANNEVGMQIVDISDPQNVRLCGTYNTQGSSNGVIISNNYAYIADGTGGLNIADISLKSPVLISSSFTNGWAYEMAISKGFAYVPDGLNGLQIFDISNPFFPAKRGNIDTSGNSNNVAIIENYAYLSDGSNGLQIIDVADPDIPKIIGTCNSPGFAYHVAVKDNFAYLADGSSGMQIIDISNPNLPVIISSYYTPGSAHSIALSGNHAFIADNTGGLQIIDILNPYYPEFASSIAIGNAYNIAIMDNIAYIANNNSSLYIIDISNPISPQLIGFSNSTSNTTTDECLHGISVQGNYAYIADYTSGFHIVDITNKYSPISIGVYETPGYAQGAYAINNYLFVSDGNNGIQIYRHPYGQ
jgi:hypothetical protein